MEKLYTEATNLLKFCMGGSDGLDLALGVGAAGFDFAVGVWAVCTLGQLRGLLAVGCF